MSKAGNARGRSIAWPILALVIASVAMANIVSFAITFSGPPPRDPPRGPELLGAALATGRQPRDPGPRLRIYDTTALPSTPLRLTLDPFAAARVAEAMHVPAASVRAWTNPRGHDFAMAFWGRFIFAWDRGGGHWRVVENPRPPVFSRWHLVTLLSMLAAVAALSLPAWLLARAISGPLRRLASAAEGARVGAPLVGMPTSGPREVQALAGAIAAMHERLGIEAHGRTQMLAAISHDLGTPLARLAFWVERLPDEARLRAAADIDEMRAMIASVLAFTRDEAGAAPAVRLDLGSLLDSLAHDRQTVGEAVSVTPGPAVVLRGDPAALRRLFGNLVDNAVRYAGAAEVGWTLADRAVEVTVADRGAGVDAAGADRLFEPFVRGDPSRNRATGGTGLGLAIVRSIATAHGGTAMLANRPGGGAIATVRLPAEAATRRNNIASA